ncbi:hypothetical protein PMAYCL1PPCAC_26879, partial [Pristionchus mayeri]
QLPSIHQIIELNRSRLRLVYILIEHLDHFLSQFLLLLSFFIRLSGQDSLLFGDCVQLVLNFLVVLIQFLDFLLGLGSSLLQLIPLLENLLVSEQGSHFKKRL